MSFEDLIILAESAGYWITYSSPSMILSGVEPNHRIQVTPHRVENFNGKSFNGGSLDEAIMKASLWLEK